MIPRELWIEAAWRIPLALIVVTVLDNLASYWMRHPKRKRLFGEHMAHYRKLSLLRALEPNIAWALLLGFTLCTVFILGLSDSARFWVMLSEVILCFSLALYLSYKTTQFFPQEMYILSTIIFLGIFVLRFSMWEFVCVIDERLSRGFVQWAIGGGAVLLLALLGLAFRRHPPRQAAINSIIIVFVFILGFLLAYSWLFQPLLAMER